MRLLVPPSDPSYLAEAKLFLTFPRWPDAICLAKRPIGRRSPGLARRHPGTTITFEFATAMTMMGLLDLCEHRAHNHLTDTTSNTLTPGTYSLPKDFRIICRSSK
ncbi:MAG: hypothetical protein R3A47_00190 [Polyangiales bacterium]